MNLKKELCEPFGGLRRETVDVLEKVCDKYALAFHKWMRENDTPENAETWFGFSDDDMLNAFKIYQTL